MTYCICNKTGGCENCNPFLLKDIVGLSFSDIKKMLQEIDDSANIPDNIVWKIAKKYGVK